MLAQQYKGKLQELIALFKAKGGTNDSKILIQITYLLYLRFISNFGDNIINNAKVPGYEIYSFYRKIRWDRFSKETPDTQYNLYNDYVLMFIRQNIFKYNNIKEYRHAFENLINTPEMLAKAVKLIDEAYDSAKACGWDNIKANGEIYDYLLDECVSSNKGAYERTPRHIANFMCALTKPTVHDRIIDPTCGIGYILTSAVNYIIKDGSIPEHITQDDDGLDTIVDIQNAIENNDFMRSVIGGLLNGYDSSDDNVFFCAMHMLFHGIESPRIEKMDVLSREFDQERRLGSYNVVITNPPFGQYISNAYTSIKLLEYPTKRIELLYFNRTIDLLAENGRASIILPEGVLFSSERASVAIRRKLVESCRIDAVFSLPAGTFRPLSSVKASIIVFTKRKRNWDDLIWFYELENDGYSLNNRRRKLTENPLPEALKWFDNKESNDKAFCVEISKIIENNYNLSCENYKDYGETEEPLEDPQDIISDLLSEEKDLMLKLNELKAML